MASKAGARRLPIMYASTIGSSSSAAARASSRRPQRSRSRPAPGARAPRQRSLDVLEIARDPGTALSTLPSARRSSARPGCGIPPTRRPAGTRVGSREVARAAPDLADLVVPGGRDDAVEVAELLTGRNRLRFCVRPVAPQTHDLRAVHAALPGRPLTSGRRTNGSRLRSTRPRGESRPGPGTS